VPKWTDTKVAGYTLYFTAHDKGEPVHSHASSRRLVEAGSAKIWVDIEGNTQIADKGTLTAAELNRVCRFIKNNKNDLFEAWQELFGDLEFFGKPDERFILDDTGKLKSN